MKFLSNVVASGSGSFGGTTVSRNRYGMYMRSRVTPVNPSSSFQAAVRAVFAQMIDAWTTVLTDAEREAWSTYAANVPVVGTLGEQQFLTGQNHYVRSNSARIQGGFARIDAAPAVFDLGSVIQPGFTPDASNGSTSVSFDDSDAWANEAGGGLLVYQGIPQNASRTFYKGPWRYIGSVVGATPTPPITPAVMNSPYTLAENQQLWFYVRALRADGRLTNRVYGSASVQA